ncbi:MAG: flagellar motor protein MotB, partial [Rhizobiaceae bacterium]
MSFPTGEHKQEIIIVKRGGDHDHGHHGGAWKIAFADFMTAMMCFFLVMWLINAANEQTKASVASYFNPVRLIDRNSSRKGLEDIGDGPNSAGSTADKATNPVGKAAS